VRRRDQPDAFCTTTRNVAVEADLYALPTDGGLDDALEVAVSEIEGLLPGYLAGLRDGPTPRKGSQAREDISDLLALQIVRTREHVGQWMFPLAAAEYTGERAGRVRGEMEIRPDSGRVRALRFSQRLSRESLVLE
jgi:hypothetical protein